MSPHQSPERARTPERGRNRAEVFPFPKASVPSSKRKTRGSWSGRAVSLLFFPATVLPQITRVLFSRRPYYLRAWHKLFFLTWPSQPVIKIQPWPSPAWKHKMYKERVGDSYGMKDLFISLSKREGKSETSVYKQTTLVKVQVVLFYFYNLWNDNKW